MDIKQPPLIGLVGGVGSGKTAVARWLADHIDGHLIDADLVGHQVLLREDVKAEIRREFGEIVFAEGEIDRNRLATAVFGDDPEQVASRSRLESIVHPVIGRIIREQIAAARQNESVRLIVFDAAVVLEFGWRDDCDVVAFIDVPSEERLRRVAGTRGWSEDELSRREASQWPLDRKREASDVVIDNSHTVEQAGRQLADYLLQHGWLKPRQPKISSPPDQDEAPALSESL